MTLIIKDGHIYIMALLLLVIIQIIQMVKKLKAAHTVGTQWESCFFCGDYTDEVSILILRCIILMKLVYLEVSILILRYIILMKLVYL